MLRVSAQVLWFSDLAATVLWYASRVKPKTQTVLCGKVTAIAAAIAGSIVLGPLSIAADPLPQPKVCVGYNPETDTFGRIGAEDYPWQFGFCPHGYAMVATARVLKPDRVAKELPGAGDCCPLPEDALTDEHKIEVERCPDGYVVTGSMGFGIFNLDECTQNRRSAECDKLPYLNTYYLRCTKINPGRYQLGPSASGIDWGWNHNVSGRWVAHITRMQIPAGLRYAVGRISTMRWAVEGCIGDPIGSLFVEKVSRRCDGYKFSQLQYRGVSGDPAGGTPVQIFPDCTSIDDRLSRDPRCLR